MEFLWKIVSNLCKKLWSLRPRHLVLALKKVASSLQQTLGNIKMATTNFVHGTLIESTWLNDADAHIYDQATVAHTAAHIPIVDAGAKFTATDVEGALQELATGGA